MNEAWWAQKFSQKIKDLRLTQTIRIMEVCGTHTMNIARFAIRSLLPPEIQIISGPGCPVCVTDPYDLGLAFCAADDARCLVATFGDVLRIPWQGRTLGQAKNVIAVASPSAALDLAQAYPQKEVVFLAIGFETTAPLTAAAVIKAHQLGLKNFSILAWHKLIIPALEFLLAQQDLTIDGFLLPGHVAAVTGSDYFSFLNHRKAGVISGFSAAEIMAALAALGQLIKRQERKVKNFYPHVVHPAGNQKAMQLLQEVFCPGDAYWHGIGCLPASGLQLKSAWANFDSVKKFAWPRPTVAPTACRCGEIMLGKISPPACPLYGHPCTPAFPQGPCMVSSEGTCAAYFKYRRQSR